MFDLAQDSVILAAATIAALLFTLWLNRLWPKELRSKHNELFGWHLNILGTTYAVILGFMLYTVWTAYGEAQLNVDLEANSLRNLYRLADALPQPEQLQLQQEARSYADIVLNEDWPEMANEIIPETSHHVNEAMWKTLTAVQSGSIASVMVDHALSELSSLTEHRRTRLLQSTYRLPTIFWLVLIAGAIIILISAALFGAKSVALHSFQVASLTLLVTLVLLAIGDVNRPFQGWVHVGNYAFIRAQQEFAAH